MKLIEILQRIQSLYSKGLQSDDTRLSYRHIYNKILTARNFLLNTKQIDLNNKKLYQSIDCVLIDKSEITDCSCSLDINCSLKRTNCKIPEFYSKDKAIITSIDGHVKFNYIPFENVKYLSGNKYTSKNPYYFIKDNYIYLLNTGKMKIVRIKGIFSNPIEAETFSCGDNTNKCKNILDIDFPVPDELIDLLIQQSLNELIQIFSQMREDLSNDSKDSVIQNSK